MDETNWSLERSFDSSHYDAFLQHLPRQEEKRCRAITYGNMFSNDPNGSIFATDYGSIVTISDSLQFFLKFMHLALLDFGETVPVHVRLNALRIAIRVMLKTEALDFLMDPRGIVPRGIAEAMHSPITYQLRFIAGHEFAHNLLGHLSEARLESRPIYFAISANDQAYKPIKVYSRCQKDELDADILALTLPRYKTNERKLVWNAALLWFAWPRTLRNSMRGYLSFLPMDTRDAPIGKRTLRKYFDQRSGVPQFEVETLEGVHRNYRPAQEISA